MRIISKFHDYYDSVMRTGVDKECVYVRNEEEIILNEIWKHTGNLSDIKIESTQNKNYSCQIEKFIIGFCGKIYPCIEERISWRDYCYNHRQKIIFHYSKEFIDEKDYDKYFYKGSFFDKNFNEFESYFEKYKVPVFVTLTDNLYSSGRKLILNPQLKKYEFFKIKDSYTTYQEIYMYLSGVLGVNQKEIINISDKDKIKKKGFDKFSFKKISTKIK